jgi:sulfonate transport system substrate-binding protein
MNTLSRRSLLLAAGAVPLMSGAARAAGLIPQPAPLAAPVKLTVGYAKVAHLAPMVDIDKVLAPMGITIELAEFVRYADSRTAMATGSLDITPMAAGDLPLLLSQGVTSVVGITGVASSAKYPVVHNGVTADTWEQLSKLRLGVAPGSAVWYQFVAKVQELGLRYNQFQIVNIQGSGANFVQALQRGDVDAYINAEPTDSMPEAQGFGHSATALDYSQPKAVGAELGLLTATKSALSTKGEAVRRFMWAYLTKERELAADQAAYALAIQKFCGLDAKIATLISGKIKLGGVIDADQLVRLTKFLAMAGIITKDVSGEVASYYDPSIVKSVMAG